MDDVRNLAISFGAKGLAWITYMENGEVKSPVLKFLNEDQIKEIQTRAQAQNGDIVFFVADHPQIVFDVLGRFRLYFGAFCCRSYQLESTERCYYLDCTIRYESRKQLG